MNALRGLGVASRAEIARRTGLSPATVSTLVTELRDSGLVVDHDGEDHELQQPATSGGRPPMLIALGRSAGVAAGVDFGKRHLGIAVCDLSHDVLAELREEMPEDYDAPTAMTGASRLLDVALKEAGAKRSNVIGVGVGAPGPIHMPTGTVGSSSILPGWGGIQITHEMEAHLDVPVLVDNDANLGALAEMHWGAGRGASQLAYVKVATGIGAGLVIDDRIYYGAGGTAGEIGHVMLEESGPICRCGSRGCLEMYASAPAVVEMLKPSVGRDLDVDAMIELAAGSHLGARRAIGDAGRRVGEALANLVNLMNPERIVVGGTLSRAGDVLLEPMRDALSRRAIPSAVKDVQIVPGVLGDRAEVLGAVALVLYGQDRAAERALVQTKVAAT